MSEEVKEQEVIFNFATIGELFEDGVSLIFDGQKEATEKHYKVNTSVWFQPGDRVKICQDSGTYVVEYVVGRPRQAQLVGIPAGGTKGQVLGKTSEEDYAASWGDIPEPDVNGVLPTGGAAGQFLKKTSTKDYDAQWADLTGVLPAGGTDGQVLTKSGATDFTVKWSSAANPLPTGGSAGQFLKKSSSVNYAVEWGTISGLLPTGGSSGQVLTKTSSSNYAVEWESPSASALKSGTNTLTLSTKTLTPSATGFAVGTSSYPVTFHASTLRVYYSSYRYVDIACNSSGNLTVGGTEIN